jgi:hypothetical protein
MGGGWNTRSHTSSPDRCKILHLPLYLVMGPLDQRDISNLPLTKWHGSVGSRTLVRNVNFVTDHY